MGIRLEVDWTKCSGGKKQKTIITVVFISYALQHDFPIAKKQINRLVKIFGVETVLFSSNVSPFCSPEFELYKLSGDRYGVILRFLKVFSRLILGFCSNVLSSIFKYQKFYLVVL